MKFILSILFILQGYLYACNICATEVPKVSVSGQISYEKEKTTFDIKWQFHKEFLTSLIQYDLNENNIFDNDEQILIKESLVDYIQRFHYLTDIKYKHINKQKDPQYIQHIEPTLSELEFKDNTMMYHYKFSLPFVLTNKHTLYIGFNDERDNFSFSIKNLIVNNYNHPYTLENKLIYVKIKLDDPIVPEPKHIEQKKTTQTYLEVLSTKLTLLKNNLKITLKDIKVNNNLSSYIWLLIFSFLYGIIHAIGPGHGKSLVSSYFINQKKSYVKALSISIFIGITHTFSAFLLTLFVYLSLGFIFNSAIVNIEQIATKLSAIIIIMIALYLIYKKIRKSKNNFQFSVSKKQSFISPSSSKHTSSFSCACNSCKTTSTDIGIILAAGIIPCPGTVTIFLFTMSLGIYFVGFMSALFMSAGMSLIIFITAIISVRLRKSSSQNKILIKILEYGSLTVILMLGILLLIL